MPRRETSIVHLLTPFYRAIIINDPEHYADPAARGLARPAAHEVVAATPYTVLIGTAQDLLRLELNLQVWNGAPPFRDGRGWSRSGPHPIDCPTGELSVVPLTGSGFGSGPLPEGPGPYLIDVLWRGREGAEVRARETRKLIADMSSNDAQRAIGRFAGLEKYRIRVWPGTPTASDGY